MSASNDSELMASAPHLSVTAEQIPGTEWAQISVRLRLSRRESEVLRHAINGDNNLAIGRRLRIAESTVHVHRDRLYRKLGVNSLARAVVIVFSTYLSIVRAAERY
jgi:DNA-binding NarL/FixJ family response regulator